MDWNHPHQPPSEPYAIHNGYQQSTTGGPVVQESQPPAVLASNEAPLHSISSKLNNNELTAANQTAAADGTEKLKLLQLKTPSYSTTNMELRGERGDSADGAKPFEEMVAPMDSSHTAILPLDLDDIAGDPPPANRSNKDPFGGRRQGGDHPSSASIVESSSPTPTVQIWAYRRDMWLRLLTGIFCVFTFGVLALILYWKPRWRAIATALPCKLSEANLILIKDEHNQYSLENVQTLSRSDGITFLDTAGAQFTSPTFRIFDHRKVRFIWHPKRGQFQILADFDQRCPTSMYYQRQDLGLTQQLVQARAACYGRNDMRVEVTPLHQLFFREALQPLSIFQVFSVILWFTEGYLPFGFVIILMTSISWMVNMYTTRKSQQDLRRMVGSSGHVSILRDGIVQYLPSSELVPGDVVVLDPEADCQRNVDYDAILISGGCVINESALTGESVPVTKTSMFYAEGQPKEIFDYRIHGRHVIYSGTKLLQIRSSMAHPAKVVVLRTGFHTAKGRLVRSILFPKPIDFRFTKDLLTFLFTLGIIGFIGMIYAAIVQQRFANITYDIRVLRILDVITIVVPPLLPAAMSVGVVLAQNRLRKKKIYCISPAIINACGSVDAVCFDKTGTLTEDGLELTQIRTINRGRFDEEKSAQNLSPGDRSVGTNERHALRLMATCHTLVLLHHSDDEPPPSSSSSNRMSHIGGDPIDMALFEKTGYQLIKPSGLTIVQHPGCVLIVDSPQTDAAGVDKEKFLIMQQFIFTSSLKRMSVIVRDQISGMYSAYCKGAPETVKGLCLPETIPSDFDRILSEYTKEGCRVIAMALKRLSSKNGGSTSSDQQDQSSNVGGGGSTADFDPRHWTRDRIESDMAFLGFCVLENRLKPATTPIIYDLNQANIRSVMITGDHVDTAVHVARQCGMIGLEKKLYLIDYDRNAKHPILKLIPPPAHMEAPRTPAAPSGSVFVAKESTDFEIGTESTTYNLAITGTVFAQLCTDHPDLLARLAAVCSIYARMAPEQKTQVVGLLQSIDYTVAACGDGANDCGALKAAHAGISLSEAEASIASPFTSHIADISCVPALISEGRAALVTSFGLAKYMAAYSFIQFFTVCLLYSVNADLASPHLVFADLFLVTLLSIVFGRTPAEEHLYAKPPPNKLVSPPVVIGMLLHALVTIVFQGMAFGVVQQQPWFNATIVNWDSFSYQQSMVATYTFLPSMFQYVWVAFVFAKGFPYRKPFYYNWLMLIVGAVQIIFCVWFTLDTGRLVTEMMYFIPSPDGLFRFCILAVAGINLLAYLFVELFVVDWFFLKKLRSKKQPGLIGSWLSGRARQPPTHARIVRLIGDSPNWITAAQPRI